MTAPAPPASPRAASAAAIDEAAQVSTITQLVLAERECRDMGRWERMKSCYHPDGFVHISWFNGSTHDFVDASREMAGRGVMAKHRLGPVSVRVKGTRAVATLAGIIDIPAVVKGVAVQLASHARMFYRAECRDGQWKLSSFEAFYMRDELAAQIPGDAVPVTAADVAGYRRSYQFLSFVLACGGYTVRDDLPGEDRPETVEALCADIYGWAALSL